MKLSVSCVGAVVALAAGFVVPPPAAAQLQAVEAKAVDAGFVHEFYLEGNAIPTQKRNTVIVKGTDGKRLVASLLDTTGYSADIQAKYLGMLIVERPVLLGGAHVPTGAYGFGLQKPQPPEGPATLSVYDVGGAKVAEAQAAYDAALAHPVPLQVVTQDGQSRLCVGRHCVALK